MYIHIYIYMYRERERMRETHLYNTVIQHHRMYYNVVRHNITHWHLQRSLLVDVDGADQNDQRDAGEERHEEPPDLGGTSRTNKVMVMNIMYYEIMTVMIILNII